MRKLTGIIALAVCVSVAGVQADVVYSLNEVPNTLPGLTTYDLVADVTGDPVWDWLGSRVIVNVNGPIYVDPGVAFVPEPARYLPPNPFQILAQPNVAFTTYVGAPNMAERGFPGSGIIQPETPTVADYDADAPGGVLDITIFDTAQFQGQPWTLLRLTVPDDTVGTIVAETDYDTTLGVAGGKVAGGQESIPVGGGVVWDPPSAQEIIDTSVPGGVTREDWDNNPANAGRGGWNNPAREITITLSPPGGNIVDYEWDFGGGVTKSGATVTVSAAELFLAGWPHSDPPEGYLGQVEITMTQQDGATDSGTMNVFLPEPATVVLLGLGAIVTLVRRRRS